MSGAGILESVAAAIRRSDFAQAAKLSVRGIEAGVRHPLLFNVRAQWLETQGRDQEALADLDRAHALAPGDAGVLEALGLLQLKMGFGARARQTFRQLLASRPNYAYGYHCAGLAAEAVGDLEAAERHFRSSDRYQPRQPGTLSRLAAIAARRGVWSDARVFADRALSLDARAVDAVFVHATADLAEGTPAAAIARLRPILTDTTLPAAIRGTANSINGDALDALLRTDDAFAAYSEAGRLLEEAFAPSFGSRERMTDSVTRLRAIVEESSAGAEVRTADAPATGHVFVIGFPRSGTTLLERILAAHPAVASAEEREYLGEPATTYLTDKAGFDALQSLSAAELDKMRSSYWDRVREDGVEVNGKVFIDKLPLNSIKLPLLRRLFPSAKVVLALRDPRDVVFSCFRRRFAMNPAMFELITLTGAARSYDAVMSLVETCERRWPFGRCLVKYETLVANPRAELERLCHFVGLEWSDTLLDFAALAGTRAIATPSANQVRRGLYREGIGQWRRYERHLEIIQPTLRPWLERWGYEP